MADVAVTFIGDFMQDVGEVTVESCVWFEEVSTLESGEAAAADEVAAEIDSISDSKRSEQMFQQAKCNQL